MKALPLRRQLAAVVVFLQLCSLGVGLAYWHQTRAHVRLEQSFQHDLAVLSRLPRLRDDLRRLDLWTDRFLVSGEEQALEKRGAALQEVRKVDRELAALPSEGRERETLTALDAVLASYVAEQDQWISRKRAGRLPSAQAARLVERRNAFEGVLSLLVQMKNENLAQLEVRRRDVDSASKASLVLILVVGLAAALFTAFFLLRYMVTPVVTLRDYALSWTLGSEWTFKSAHASPEIADLLTSMGELTARLNKQFAREHELGELKGRLVSMVSHEFNNVLSTLGSVAYLLRETEAGEPTKKRLDYYAIMESNIRSLSLAAGNLLEMGRLESGRFAVAPVETILRTLAEQALRGLELLYQRKSLDVRLEFPPEPLSVRADPEALSLVLTNLISNAIKYTPEKGRITVGLLPEDGKVRFYCQDTGIGISEDDQKKVFSGYYRTESGRKQAKGFGVGLSLAHSVIEAHGSRLEVESAPGQGARFSFLLPLWTNPV